MSAQSAKEKHTKSLYVETYGCQMNEYDSGLVKTLLDSHGYKSVDSPETADVILLNTCAIREKAHERVYIRVEGLAYLKRRRGTKIGILGCMAQNLSDDLLSMGLPVDLIVGPDNYRSLPALLEGVSEQTQILTRLSLDETYSDVPAMHKGGPTAMVTIMRGCNNFCSFCVVPHTRGRERSRTPESVIHEVRTLVENGVKEITLLGQNVNSYRFEGADFAELVRRALGETDVARIRFTSPHPHHFPDHLLDLMAADPRFCPQVHLPLQSGSTAVLERMNRDYSRSEYLTLVEKIRDRIPHVSLTTDVIAGFSGETEEQFEETLSVVDSVGFDMAYMFRYSEREHTLAKRKFPDDIAEEVKQARLERLIALQLKKSAASNMAETGRAYEVLVEGPSRRSQEEMMGRTPQGKVIVFAAHEPSVRPGDMVHVRVASSTSATLRGRMLEPAPV